MMDKKQDLSNRESQPFVKNDKKSIILPIIGIIAAMGLLFLAWWFATRPTPTLPSTPANLPHESLLTEAEINSFFETEVLPALSKHAGRNKAAVDRAVNRISKGIDEYKEGIPDFVEDVTSWETRFGVIGRGSLDLWNKWWGEPDNATMVHDYVSGKFERHLFSSTNLMQLVESSLTQFRDDLKASQNRLHADIKTAWKSKAYGFQELDLQQIVAAVDVRAKTVSKDMATDSITVGVLAFVGGLTLEQTTESLVKVIFTRITAYLATSAVTTTVSSGGATGTGAAAGGASGSTVGPWGTVIGVATGIVVGIIADWWMTNQFEEKLTSECEQMLTDVKSQILVGTEDAPGMKQAFVESIHVLGEAEEHAIHDELMGMAQ